MPNWCKGNLKIRGKIEDVKKFLDEQIYKKGEVILEKDEIKLSGVDGHLKDTYRCFISAGKDGFHDEFYARRDGNIIVIIPVQHAWGPYLPYFEELSEKYNVDFRFYGYERGLEFNCEFEIIKGNITIHRKIEFDNYEWECPEPRLGG
ncbi:hypothetical protein [Pasteurella multocida]|uniref:hypothetical protein n=1 Tax=Pasteurella multocida TaxID=747 RepID=UPI00099908F0|nr:hypothetical protein [Pasteurella multocida]MBE7394606.1 hypothetical protein [Pasteurella multocida]MCL7755746.1 hypothetical protein [Pasteurella multocida]MCL7779873.1 hypothetical protein [Pasteurella multocida]OPC91172.1 hypothetical protein BTV60_05260 [Pasteurella multocida subsp. septica]OPD03798.1 hypothetical protein BTV56_04395 [Pasteurella multocida subsp. septica]